MTGSDTEIEVRDILTGDALFCSGGDLLQVIREEGYTISANGSVFNGSFGILSEFVQEIFMERKKNKKLSADYAKAGDNELHVIHDLVQKVLKIFANSVYGATSNVNFRLFDLDLAKSITLTGQMVSKHQAYKANALLEEYVEMIENE
jgi:DNA polymerase elongation subunit (family B)